MSNIIFEERSTGSIVVEFTDRNENPVVPNWIKWTLSDTAGGVINGRKAVDFPQLAQSAEIKLAGDDLQILSGETGRSYVVRILTIEAEYNSDLGLNLPLNGQYEFMVKNLTYINIPAQP